MSIDSVDVKSGRNGAAKKKDVSQITQEPVSEVTSIRTRCPHFALGDDPDTTILFPSPAAYCYNAAPPTAVKLEHQQAFCLNQQHAQCPAFLQEEPAPLPHRLRRPRQSTAPINGRRRRRIMLGSVAVLTLILFTWAGLTTFGSFSQDDLPAVPTQVVAAILPDPTETEAAVVVAPTAVPTQKPTRTAVAIVATEPPTTTPNPTATLKPTPPPTSAPLPPPPPVAQVSVPFVNVRYGPDTAYGLVTNLREAGAQFEVIGRDEAGNWWQLCCVDDAKVWIAQDALELSGDIDSVPVAENPLSHAVVEVERLNIRRSPDLEGEVLQIIVRRDRFDVTGRLFDDSWWQICCVDGETGWVYGESVSIEGLLDEIPIVNRP